jgi:Bacterial SH3 domain
VGFQRARYSVDTPGVMPPRCSAQFWVAACALILACQHGATPGAGLFDVDVYRRAEAERLQFYEREVQRLRADLAQAEQSLVAMESGLRGSQSRADAVSALAEGHIALERVSSSVPWRPERVAEARSKLAEASRQLEAGHVGSAVFFTSRARRITEDLQLEVEQVAAWSDKRLVRGDHVYLRSGPSRKNDVVDTLMQDTPVFPERSFRDWTLVRTPDGRIGWVHAPLLAMP